MIKSTETTRDELEIDKFDKLADEWWNPSGKFKLLHEINPLRIGYIKNQVASNISSGAVIGGEPLKGLKILDIGCGGGLITLPLSKLGADITGIDASEKNIKVAKIYAERKNYNATFTNQTIEEYSLNNETKFDVILALEVIEHVFNYKLFLQEIVRLLRPGGILVISTINRTLKSLALAKIGAEYILRMLPIGTHDWNKFLTPNEIADALSVYGLVNVDISGMSLNLMGWDWYLSKKTDVNYFATYQKVDKTF